MERDRMSSCGRGKTARASYPLIAGLHRSGRSGATLFTVHDASVEVRGAVVYATFIVALVFVPVLTMSGVQGRLFAPLGWTYILATLASLVVALTVTPALSYFLLPKAIEKAREPSYIRSLKDRYGRLLHFLSARPRILMIAAGAICVLAATALPFPWRRVSA
jgi:Cu/Ag efflux pump CusA